MATSTAGCAAFAGIRKRLREEITADTDGDYWTDSMLDIWIDEAQLVYARQTRALRRRAPVQLTENVEVYCAPEDCYEIMRLELSDGKLLLPSTSVELERSEGGGRMDHHDTWLSTAAAGRDWISKTGTPNWWYQDLDGRNKFRLHPRPATAIAAETTPFTAWPSRVPARSPYGPLDGDSITTDGNNRLWWAQQGAGSLTGGIALYDREWRLISRFGLSAMGYYGYTKTGIAAYTGVTSSQGSKYGDVFYTHDVIHHIGDGVTPQVALYKVVDFNVSSGFRLIVSNISGSSEWSRMAVSPSGKWVYYGTDGSTRYSRSDIDTDAELIAETLHQAAGIEDLFTLTNGKMYMAFGDSGLYRFNDIPAPGEGVAVTSTKVYGVCKTAASTLYINLNGTLARLDTETDTITPTGITTLDSASQLYQNGHKVWAHDINHQYMCIDTTTAGSENVEFIYGGPKAFGAPKVSGILNDNLVFFAATDDALTYVHAYDAGRRGMELWQYDPDIGVTSYVDAAHASPDDDGAIVDYTDTSEGVFFDGEEGVIASVTNDATAAIVYYSADPRPGVLEVNNDPAIIAYAAMKCYEVDEEQEDLQRASYFRGRFEVLVNEELSSSGKGWTTSRERKTEGSFF